MAGHTVRLAFASVTENSDIWSVPLDPNQGRVTGEVKRLTQDTAADFQPALSQDGNKMAWVSARSGNQEIWISDLRTGEESALTASRTDKWQPRFSPDGLPLSVSSYEGKKWNIYIIPASGGTPERVCEDCGEATGWSSDGKRIIGNRLEGQTWLVDLNGRRKNDLLATRQWAATGTVSPDNSWFAFWISRWLNVAPFSGTFPVDQSAWIPVMDDAHEDFIWTPDGNLLYTISGRDRFTYIWAQRVDTAIKRPVGAPFAIFHSHTARMSLADEVGRIKLGIGRDKILFNMAERTGNIWMAEWRQR